MREESYKERILEIEARSPIAYGALGNLGAAADREVEALRSDVARLNSLITNTVHPSGTPPCGSATAATHLKVGSDETVVLVTVEYRSGLRNTYVLSP